MRLINKYGKNDYGFACSHDDFFEGDGADKIIHKLGQLEDVEEELGIDLITLFKALKNGVWIKYKKIWETKYKIEHFNPDEFAICFHDGFIMFCTVRYYGDECGYGRSIEIEGDYDDTHYFRASNYGKTWALTKEELL